MGFYIYQGSRGVGKTLPQRTELHRLIDEGHTVVKLYKHKNGKVRVIKMGNHIQYDEHKVGCHELKFRYFDKNGVEVNPGDTVRFALGRVEKVYATENGELGTDATNPKWVESGRAVPCEYGIYPFTYDDMTGVEVITDSEKENK